MTKVPRSFFFNSLLFLESTGIRPAWIVNQEQSPRFALSTYGVITSNVIGNEWRAGGARLSRIAVKTLQNYPAQPHKAA